MIDLPPLAMVVAIVCLTMIFAAFLGWVISVDRTIVTAAVFLASLALVVMIWLPKDWLADNPSGWGDPCAAVSDDYAHAVIDWRYTIPGVGTIASGRCAP